MEAAATSYRFSKLVTLLAASSIAMHVNEENAYACSNVIYGVANAIVDKHNTIEQNLLGQKAQAGHR